MLLDCQLHHRCRVLETEDYYYLLKKVHRLKYILITYYAALSNGPN